MRSSDKMRENETLRQTDERSTRKQNESAERSLQTPGHAAAAASLSTLASPSRISRVTLSPARASDGQVAPHFQRSTSSSTPATTMLDERTDVAASDLTSSQELASSSSTTTTTTTAAIRSAPSLSVDLAEFPPARSLNTANEEGGNDVGTTHRQKRQGVDFLTQRLRSAIGQDLLHEHGMHSANDDEEGMGEPLAGSIDVEPDTGGSRKRDDNVKSTLNDGQTVDTSHQGKPLSQTGWGWSALATIPAALRIDGAFQSLSIQTSPGSTDQTDKPSSVAAGDASKDMDVKVPADASDAGNGAMMSYMAALDVRKWLPGGSNASRAGETVQTKSGGGIESSVPRSPFRDMPAGSYPSSRTTKQQKKERERAAAEQEQREREAALETDRRRKEASESVIEYDLTQEEIGVEVDGKGAKVHFAAHEYLVLSTAGKPVFWSRVSKARLERARVNRKRRRTQQDALQTKRKNGIDVSQEAGEIEKREEGLAKDEQAVQDEEDQLEATRVGLLQAIISNFAETDREKLHATAKEVLELPQKGKVCFLLRPPLYLVAVSRWDDAESTLRNHLDYLYQAIISLVSVTKLNRLFDRAANFDLKRLLQGTDNILDALLTRLQDETIAMRGALQPMRLDAALRHDVGAALLPSRSKHARPQDALYALLLTRRGIITLARRRKNGIHPTDCHLLINTVLSTKALKEGGTQTWVPICLPKFAPQGFVYAHVSFLDDDAVATAAIEGTTTHRRRRPELGLVLITGNPDGFDEMSAWRERIVGFLREGQLLSSALRIARAADEESIGHFAPTSASYSADELGIAGLRHFCFKWRSNVQSTSPSYEAPYTPGSQDGRRLLYLYALAYDHVVRTTASKSTSTTTSKEGDSASQTPAQSDVETRKGKDETMSETDDASSRASIAERSRKKVTVTSSSAANVTTNDAVARRRRANSPPPIVARSVLTGKTPEHSTRNDTLTTSSNGVGSGGSGGTGMQAAASAFVDAVRTGSDAVVGKARRANSTMHILKTSSETVLAWPTQPFELYICASPHVSHTALIAMAKSVVRWVKQEEHRLFIVSAPVF